MGSPWKLASDLFPGGYYWHGLRNANYGNFFQIKILYLRFSIQMRANTLFGLYAGVPPILSPLNKWANGKKGGSRT